MGEGFRPVNPSVKLEYPFVAENGVDPTQPTNILDVPTAPVIAGIQQSWSLVKKQADVMLLVDTSGSMSEEDKIGQAKQAAEAFLNAMESANRVGLTTFSDTIYPRIPLGQFESVRTDLVSSIQGLRADGGTALFDALEQVVGQLNDEDDSDRIRAVVLLSDGGDTASSSTLNDVLKVIAASHDSVNPVIVIPVAYGSGADTTTLGSIARASSTTLQAGDPKNILSVLNIISGYF